MNHCSHHTSDMPHSSHSCGCHGGSFGVKSGMWSRKKKIRFLETQLESLDEQKRDIEELIAELKEQA